MTNYRSDAQSKLDIILDKVCVASKRYSIKPMAGQTGKNDKKSSRHTAPSGISDCGLQIGRQEQVTLHYLISPLDVNEAKCTYSHCLINGEGASERTSDSLVTDFICLEHAHDRFQVRYTTPYSIKCFSLANITIISNTIWCIFYVS